MSNDEFMDLYEYHMDCDLARQCGDQISSWNEYFLGDDLPDDSSDDASQDGDDTDRHR